MLFGSILAALCTLAGIVGAAPAPAPAVTLRCSTQPSASDVSRVETTNFRQFNVSVSDEDVHRGTKLPPWKPPPHRFWLNPIQVAWHVISAGPTQAQGMVSVAQMHTQISVLNQYFAPLGMRFVLSKIDYTTNPTWFTYAGPGTAYQDALKKKLHVGGRATLNVYSTGFLNLPPPNQYLGGYSSFPWDPESIRWNDGIMIKYNTLPGGSLGGWNTGRVLVHEVGHWVGLYHTFQGGCGGPGDYVNDTPAEASPASGCPTGRDSCPGVYGVDPIHNHMDYTVDSCRQGFSAGQVSRARSLTIFYRGIV